MVMGAYHRLKFDITFHFQEKYLPLRGLILDAGEVQGDIPLS